MKESIVSALEFTDPLFPQVETIELVIRQRTFRLWDALNFPDICSWPTALEAKFTGFSSATEKRGLLYTSRLSDPQQREKRKQGLQPSEIKALRFAPILSFALAPEGTSA
jgi:hypothetical protein